MKARQVQDLSDSPSFIAPLTPTSTRHDHQDKKIEQKGKIKSNSGNEGNKDAQRALLLVQKKLSQTMSIECQVNELIQSATSSENLSRMFPGWQPWC